MSTSSWESPVTTSNPPLHCTTPGQFSKFQIGFSWFHVGFYRFSRVKVGSSWVKVSFYRFSRFQVGFRGSRLVLHSSRCFFMVIHSFRLVFMVPGWFFMVPGRFSWIFMVPGWLFMFFLENVPAQSVSWPYDPVQVRRLEGGIGPSTHKMVKKKVK